MRSRRVAVVSSLLAGVLSAATPAQARCPEGETTVPGSPSSVAAVGVAPHVVYVDDRDFLDVDGDGDAGGVWIYREANGRAGLQRGGRWGGSARSEAAWDAGVEAARTHGGPAMSACVGPPDTPHVWVASEPSCGSELVGDTPWWWWCGGATRHLGPVSVHADTELDGRGSGDDDDRLVTLYPGGVGGGDFCAPPPAPDWADPCVETSRPDELLF